MKQVAIILSFVFSITHTFAQEYFKEGKNRLNFAKTYLELGTQYSPTFTGKQIVGNTVNSYKNSASSTPYLNIGGIHFWGKADFYISIPLAQLALNKNDSNSFRLNQSVVTGARFMPWAYQDNKIRPYIGASWAVVNFKQNENQPLHSKNKLLFDAGLMYGKGSFMTRLGVNFYPSNSWNYPVTESNFQEIKTPNWSANFALIYTFETTRSKNMEQENKRFNQFPTLSKPAMNATKKGDYFIGLGPSSSFMLSRSAYNESNFPYFNQKPISNTYFDVDVGYQFNKAGIVTALSFRNPKFTNEAFGTKQTINKNSIALEAYKFLTDYSGFTPYLGLNIAYDNFEYSEKNNSDNFNKTFSQINPGITFGWDILPGKTEQWFVLRTNLRWYPFSKIDINGRDFSQNQLEYNVIQAVFYPSRYKNAKAKRGK
jgi:outer membrane protein W